MIIAIDYDDTYTRDPALWSTFINLAQYQKHTVYSVTCRHDTFENREEVQMPLPRTRHIFTGHSPKRWHMEQLGIRVDVWIDDMPETILHGR
jgi:hypothetical protein